MSFHNSEFRIPNYFYPPDFYPNFPQDFHSSDLLSKDREIWEISLPLNEVQSSSSVAGKGETLGLVTCCVD
jgi:hypothetical protein